MSAKDKFVFDHDNSPATNSFAITPNNTNELTYITRAIYTGSGGNIKCLLKGDSTPQVFANVPTGSMLPLRVKKIYAEETTATNILGLY